MSSQTVFVKGDHELRVSQRFVYSIDVYRIWKKGACLLSSNYYASPKPLDSKKIPIIVRKKGYVIQRFIELEGAPKDYLINKGYKLKKV